MADMTADRRAALVEKVAEAICDAEFWPGMWETLDKGSDECALYRKSATAAIDLIRALKGDSNDV